MINELYKFIKENRIFLLIFAIFLVIRFSVFNNFYWYESSARVRQIIEFITIKGQIFNTIPHFPLSVILYKLGGIITQDTMVGIKLIHLLFNILTFFFIYKMSFLLYNNKNIANRSIIIYTLSFYVYAGTSMGIDQDLFINPFLFILTLYLYKKSKSLSFVNIIKIVIASSLLTICRPILGLVVLFIIFLDIIADTVRQYGRDINIKNILKAIFSYIKIFLPYLAVAGALSYLMYILFPDPVNKSLVNYMKMFSGSENNVSLLTRVSFGGQLFIYATPLVLSVFLLIKNFWKNQLIIISSLVMFFYAYMGLKGGDPARWMMPIVPILMIGIAYLCKQYINKRNIIVAILIGGVLLFLNSFINYQHLPLDASNYISDPLNNVFILTSTIINPMYLDSKIVFFIACFTFIIFLAILIFRKNIFLKIFLLFGLGVNLFMISTDIFQIGQPNMPKITKAMYNFCYDNCKLGDRIYFDWISKDTVLIAQEQREIGQYFDFKLNNDKEIILNNILNNSIHLKNINLFTNKDFKQDYFWDLIQKNGSGYVFLTYYYGKNDDQVVNTLEKYCELRSNFLGNEYVKGIVYYCNVK